MSNHFHQHVIWDWNCTLLDDFSLILESTNVASREIGGPVFDADTYRKHHRRPFTDMYAALFDRELSAEEAFQIGETFEQYYQSRLVDVSLSAGAERCLSQCANKGWSQSVLSMWYESELEPFVTQFGIADYFIAIHGRIPGEPDTKSHHIQTHVERLGPELRDTIDRSHITIIGDCADDAVAAKAAGINAILVASGQDTRAGLERTGYPVTDSISQATDLLLSSTR